MKRGHFIFTILLSVMFLIFGCAVKTNLADYQPRFAEEKEVADFMKVCDEAIKNGDIPVYLNCFHDDAIIRPDVSCGGHPCPIVSKTQYKEWLKGGGWTEWNVKLVEPKISINGDKATMKCVDYVGHFPIWTTFNLKKDERKWEITKLDWPIEVD